MENLQVARCDQSETVKYSLLLEGAEVGYGYVFDRDINPIEIYIYEQYRSNGYGKYLFSQLARIAKDRGVASMIFEVPESNYRFITIIGQLGAVRLGSDGFIVKFLLKLP